MNILKRLSSFFGALFLFAAALPLAAATPPQANNARTVRVMTRNLYVGVDLAAAQAAIASGDPEAIVAAVSESWAKVQFTNFPARAEGIAGEVAAAQPDLIGLQEAELWRSQTPADFVMGNADHVELDFVQILLDALAARGLHYAVVAEERGFDIELPAFLSQADFESGLLSEVRLTDREVILGRTDLSPSDLKLSNPQTGHFVTNFEIPVSPDFTFVEQRGWACVDAKVRGKNLRFITTHLEALFPGPVDFSEPVREAQAIEILDGPANTSLPVILVADSNSNANGDATTPAYASWIGAGFTDAWLQAHPGVQVSTCCADELLTSPVLPVASDDEGRIDLILYRAAQNFRALDVRLLGNDPATDRVFNGLTSIWPGDHAGVAATLQLTGVPASFWLGLKNSDDVGTRFDMLAEVFQNGTDLVGSGELDGVAGGSSGFGNAGLQTIPIIFASPLTLAHGSTLSLRVSVRVAAAGPGHRSGTARLWFNDSAAGSRFEVPVASDTNTESFYLRSGLALNASPGPGPKLASDLSVNKDIGGNPFKAFGTWTIVFP